MNLNHLLKKVCGKCNFWICRSKWFQNTLLNLIFPPLQFLKHILQRPEVVICRFPDVPF